MNDFDRYASSYSDHVGEAVGAYTECGHDFFLSAKADEVMAFLEAEGSPAKMTVLDVGCGIGLVEKRLSPYLNRVIGVDLGLDTLRHAERDVPHAGFIAYDGLRLPFGDGAFDAAFAICVMHHVKPGDWNSLVREIARVVRVGGKVMIFEHNPWNPVTRRVVQRCEFDRDAVLLPASTTARLLRDTSLFEAPSTRFLFFFPWLGRVWRKIEQFLRWLPIGAQYVTSASRRAP